MIKQSKSEWRDYVEQNLFIDQETVQETAKVVDITAAYGHDESGECKMTHELELFNKTLLSFEFKNKTTLTRNSMGESSNSSHLLLWHFCGQFRRASRHYKICSACRPHNFANLFLISKKKFSF